MVRSGGFSGGLNPFGSGSLGNLGQYDIAGDLADLEVYKVEVAWANGTANNADYLAALQKAVDARDPNTHARLAAEDKLHDAQYRIGRQAAETKGLDDLIAFDQTSLTGMTADNLKYQQVKDSLSSELAQRRSRDYGKLVTDYNAGKGSTQSLIDWVSTTLGSLAATDPDKDNWTSVLADLTQRKQGEKDAKVYQEYQDRKIKPAAFLAYVKSRRDGYDSSSPDYDEWNRKLDDATRQVKDQHQAAVDSAFFNSYQEGHKSDSQYLGYLRKRIDGMDQGNPDLPEWKHRLREATFSVAEDELRFKVEEGKAKVGTLVTFYRNYRRTLNPNSPEYRQITRSLDALAHSGGGGGGGGGGGSRSSKSKREKSSVGSSVGKQISPKYSLTNILPLLTIDPTKTGASTAGKAFDLNYTSLLNATQRGDAYWVFQDPRKPGQLIPARQVDPRTGKLVAVLDSHGKPIMVPGSAYLPVTGDALANLDQLKVKYHYDLAAIALGHHDAKGYFYQLKQASDSIDAGRVHQGQAISRDNQSFYEQVQKGIELAVKTGDYATAANLALQAKARLENELQDPSLDDTRRGRLEDLRAKLLDNELVPQVDANGKVTAPGAIDLSRSTYTTDSHGQRVFDQVVLNQGWHQVLDKTDKHGAAAWGLQYDSKQDGSWEQNHLTVHTNYGGKLVTGEVTVRKGAVSPNIVVAYQNPDGTAGGQITAPLDKIASLVSFTDEDGHTVRGYSLDGQTWIRPNAGEIPVLQIDSNDLTVQDGPDGPQLVDSQGNILFTQRGDSWQGSKDTFDEYKSKGKVTFFGEKEAKARIAAAPAAAARDLSERAALQSARRSGSLTKAGAAEVGQLGHTDPTNVQGSYTVIGGPGMLQNPDGSYSWGGGTPVFGVGAPGSHMTITSTGDDGSVNFLPPSLHNAPSKKLPYQSLDERPGRNGAPTASAAKGALPKIRSTAPSASLGAEGRGYGPDPRDSLPLGTPSRYEGIGVHGGPSGPPELRPHAPLPGLSGGTKRHVTPPKLKALPPIKAPAPKKPTTNKGANADNRGYKPPPKPKAPTPPSSGGPRVLRV